MKKILYLHAGAEMYGADKVLLELLKGLDKTEFEPHVVLPNHGILLEKLKENNIKVSVLEYPILRRKYFNPRGIFRYFKDYFHYSKELLAYCKNEQIDIIHNNTTAVLEGIYLKRKLKKPLVWHVHEIIVKPKFISDLINFLMGKYANKIITVSNAVKNHVVTSRFVDDSKLQTVYNGVDNEEFYIKPSNLVRDRFGFLSDDKIVGMIGRVNSWKGQSDFLDAMIPILRQDPSVKVMLAGSAFEGEEWRVQKLDERISKLDCKSQILRIDYYKDTIDLYNIFDIFVLPSTNPDPLPTVVLEAMACAKPIVGYRHGGICEMVVDGENGLLVTPRNTKELSKAIQTLLNDSQKCYDFSKVSLERQKALFSKQMFSGSFIKIYREVISKK